MGELHERHSWRKEKTKESLFHKINKERKFDHRFTTKTFKIIILLVIISLFSLPLFGLVGKILPNSLQLHQDPIIPIYHFCNSNFSLNRFSTRFTSIAGGSCGNHVMILSSNSTASAYAIDSQPINIDEALGHHLQINFAFEYVTTAANQPLARMFITTNKTGPSEKAGWNVNDDPNVVYIAVMTQTNPNTRVIIYLRELNAFKGNTIQQQDSGCNSGGSPFICGSTFTSITGGTLGVYTTLNFTGITSTQSLSQSCVGSGGCTGPPAPLTQNTQYQLPSAFTAGTTYYWGIEQDPNNSNAQVEFWDNVDPIATGPSDTANHWLIGVWNPPALVTPIIDTSGFFGSVLKGITFVWNGITGGLGTVYNTVAGGFAGAGGNLVNDFISGMLNLLLAIINTIKLVLNGIGNLFGISGLGDSVINFFTGIATFFSSVIAGGFSILDELATEGNRVITTITNFFTNGLSIFNFINDFLNSMSGLWSIIVGAWNEFLHWYNLSSMGISYFLVLWYFFGIYQVYLDGIQGLKSWLDMSEMFLLSIFRAGYWFSKESFGIVLTIKQLVAGWV